MLADDRLTWTARGVYSALCAADGDTDALMPGPGDMPDDVRDALRLLIACGHIEEVDA